MKESLLAAASRPNTAYTVLAVTVAALICPNTACSVLDVTGRGSVGRFTPGARIIRWRGALVA